MSVFEKQRQRVERFDKVIGQYMSVKEREIVFDCQSYHTLR